MEMSFADLCRNAKEYCDNHFKYELGYEDVAKARSEDENVNKQWQTMFDGYLAHWGD